MYISAMASVHNWVAIYCEYHVTAWTPHALFNFIFNIDIYYDLLFTVMHTLFVWVGRMKYYTKYIVFSSQYFLIFFLFSVYIFLYFSYIFETFFYFFSYILNKSPGRSDGPKNVSRQMNSLIKHGGRDEMKMNMVKSDIQ